MILPRPKFGLRSKILLLVVTGVVLVGTLSTVIAYVTERHMLLQEATHQNLLLSEELNQAILQSISAAGATKYQAGFEASLLKYALGTQQNLSNAKHLAQAVASKDPSVLGIITYPINNANSFPAVKEGTVLFGYRYPNVSRDDRMMEDVVVRHKPASYVYHMTRISLLKIFVPNVRSNSGFVTEFIMNYRQSIGSQLRYQLQRELRVALALTIIAVMVGYGLGWYIVSHLLNIHRDAATRLPPNQEMSSLSDNNKMDALEYEADTKSERWFHEWHRALHDERSSSMRYFSMTVQTLIHELRNPLTAVTTLLSVLSDTMGEAAHDKEIFRHLTTSTEHMNTVINDFSEFIKHGNLFEFQQYDITHVGRDAIDICIPHAQNSSVELELDVLPGNYVTRIDPVKLRLALVNILKNGIDAAICSPTPRTVTLTIHHDMRYLIVDVHDNGPGIPREEWTNIFLPYHSSKKDGFGLGLSICTLLVLGMGGNIFVENSSSNGTTIRILLAQSQFAGTRNTMLSNSAHPSIRKSDSPRRQQVASPLQSRQGGVSNHD